MYLKGQLSYTQSTGHIKLIYKKGQRNRLQNWRPITLLNTDYKILSKLLANRLKRAMGLVIDEMQTCSIPQRSIHANCMVTRDVITYCKQNNISLGIVSLDQEKAFDRVDHGYLQTTLEAFHFGPNFRHWIKTLYNEIGSHIQVNGWQTRRISQTRGVCQGCPLSPMLYVLSLEPLLQAIQQNKRIKGAPMPEPHNKSSQSFKVSAYADDVNVFITTNDSFTALNEELEKFEVASGSKLNRNRTNGLWISGWKSRQDSPLDIKWTTKSIKIFGIEFMESNGSRKLEFTA